MSDTAPLTILFLCYAFPPGVSHRFPSINAAGHVNETRMYEGLVRSASVRSVGLLPGEAFGQLTPRDRSSGIEHDLILWDRKPELVYWWRAYRKLCDQYRQWKSAGEKPAAVLVRNFHPVYNRFVEWLSRQPDRPRLVLSLADSSTLGQPIPLSRRLRYKFKPLQRFDQDVIGCYDACVSMSDATARFFEPHGKPWLWAPGGYHFDFTPTPVEVPEQEPVRFGFFGSLSDYAGAMQLAEIFVRSRVGGSLAVCGYGKQVPDFERFAAQHENVRFDGTLPKPTDCLGWAQQVDVLVNPRSLGWGNENNFPSKLFEYAISGRAILSSRLSGVDKLLGDLGFYFEPKDFSASLERALKEVAAVPRSELNRRGHAIRELFLREHSWDAQAARIVEFIRQLV